MSESEWRVETDGYTTTATAEFRWHERSVTLTWEVPNRLWDRHAEAAARAQVEDWPRQHVAYTGYVPLVTYG